MSPSLVRRPSSLLLAAAACYCLASLTHFFHNAEFCGDYPNLPAWITRGSVYAVWLAVTSVGATGLWLARGRHAVIGFALVAVYAIEGFGGLAHYSLAPMSQHSAAMNFTIWFEVLAGAVLLAMTLRELAISFSSPASR